MNESVIKWLIENDGKTREEAEQFSQLPLNWDYIISGGITQDIGSQFKDGFDSLTSLSQKLQAEIKQSEDDHLKNQTTAS